MYLIYFDKYWVKIIYKNYIYLICLLKDGILHIEEKILKIRKKWTIFSPTHEGKFSVFEK
jgi:hypothetical protein